MVQQLQQPFQYFFIGYQLLVTPTAMYYMYKFYRNFHLKPIDGRMPVWSMITAIGAFMFQFCISLAEIFHYTVPCGFVVFHSQFFVGIGSDAALARAFVLYFKFNLGLQNIRRAAVKLPYFGVNSESTARSKRKKSISLSNWFTKNRHKMDRWAVYYFVIATLVRLSGVISFYATTDDSSITNFECTGTDPGRENADLVALVFFIIYVLIMAFLVFKLKPAVDGLDIKAELGRIAFAYLLGIVVWFVFVQIPALLLIEKHTFPIPPMWLCLVCLYTFYETIVSPYKKTSSFKYSLEQQLEDMSKEFEVVAKQRLAARSLSAAAAAAGDNDEEDQQGPYWTGRTPGSRVFKPDTLEAAFRALLKDPKALESFTKFLQLEFSIENIFFIQATDNYYGRHLKFAHIIHEPPIQKEALAHAKELEKEFVSSDSPMTCNLNNDNKNHVETTIAEWEKKLRNPGVEDSAKSDYPAYYPKKVAQSLTKETRLQFLLQSENTPLRFSVADKNQADAIEMSNLEQNNDVDIVVIGVEEVKLNDDGEDDQKTGLILPELLVDNGGVNELQSPATAAEPSGDENHELLILFEGSNREIYNLLKRDSFRRYLKSQEYDDLMNDMKGIPLWASDPKK